MKKYEEEKKYWKEEAEYQHKLYMKFKEREELREYFKKVIEEYKRGAIWKRDYAIN